MLKNFLIFLAFLGAATAQLHVQKLEDIQDGPVTGGSFLILDQDSDNDGQPVVVGMVRHFQISGGSGGNPFEVFGRRFGPQDPLPFIDSEDDGADTFSNAGPFNNIRQNIDNHFAAIDELHDKLLAAIHCPRMREKVLDEMMRRSLILGDEMEHHHDMQHDQQQHLDKGGEGVGMLHNSLMKEMMQGLGISVNNFEDDDVVHETHPSPRFLGGDESSWGPHMNHHQQHHSHMFEEQNADEDHPRIVWINLEDTSAMRLPSPQEEEDPIDWRLWQDGHLNWALLCFMALTTSCIVVWSALLVQCCNLCSQFGDEDDEEYYYYYDAASGDDDVDDDEAPLLYSSPSATPANGNSAVKGGKKGVVVQKASDYAEPGEYVMLHYMPLNGE